MTSAKLLMPKSSTGASTVMWRAWESREQNLARGVDPATMPK